MVSLLRKPTPKMLQKLKEAQSRRGDMGLESREKSRKLILVGAETPLDQKKLLHFRNLENLLAVYCPSGGHNEYGYLN